ncbi:MAG: hypothetical protein KC561_15400 [Myxococcales bacterium]|nr:hypothetical protein [Myxococcales bacterium]
MRLRAAFTAMTVALLLAGNAAASGWTIPAESYYLKIWDRTLIGSVGFDRQGEKVELPGSYQDHALNIYFEYGIDYDWTLTVFSRPVGFAAVADKRTAYMGQTVVGVRRALLRRPFGLTAELRYGYAPALGDAPLSASIEGGELRYYSATESTHRVDLEVGAGWGLGWGWLSTRIGARYLSEFDPVLFGGAQFGVNTDVGFIASIFADFHEPLASLQRSNFSGAGETRYIGYGADFSYWFSPHFAISAGVAGAFLVESNASTPNLSLGFEFR